VNTLEIPQPETLPTRDGLSLAWYRWGTPSATPPVVLQHGFSADTVSNWVTPGVVQALLAGGRWVVGLDARGHGKSDKPHDPAMYGNVRMSADVSALIDLLHDRHGVHQVDYAGYSMGGFIGMHVISTDQRVRRAVIAAVGAAAGAATSDGGRPATVDRSAIADAMLRYADDPTLNIRDNFTNPDAVAFLRYARYTGADLRALAAHMQGPMSAPHGVDQITATTLVLAGSNDHLAESAEVLAAQIPGARCVRTPGDHLSAVGEPEFIAVLVSFLHQD
jgi:pimeloyl-ACP methyl ester carboxylesterase